MKKSKEIKDKSVWPIFLVALILIATEMFPAPMVRFNLKSPTGYSDETVIYYQAGATDGFDASYDAYKLFGPVANPHISQSRSGILFSINGISPVSGTFSIDLLATTPVSSDFTLSAQDFAELPVNTSVLIKDRYSGNSVNLLVAPYIFSLSDTTTVARFVITIVYNNQAVEATTIQTTVCAFQDYQKSKMPPDKIRLEQKGNRLLVIKAEDLEGRVLTVEVRTFPQDKAVYTLQKEVASSNEIIVDLDSLNHDLYLINVKEGNNLLITKKFVVH
jgi:hypothetical protein